MTGLRLSKAFFYILLVFLPFQTSKVFFTGKSFYYGFHAFYNTMFIYLTDLLIFGLILAWLCESASGGSRENNPSLTLPSSGEGLLKQIVNKISHDPIYLFASAFWLILATSLVFSRETSLGLYGLAKITGYLLVFAYIRENINVSRENPSPVLSPRQERGAVFWLILGTACFQSLLAIFQYLTQTSAGFSILGEEFLSPGLKGVAKFATHGIANPLLYDFFPNLSAISDTSVVMRGYGTFPHPNVLAGFLFMGLLINLYLLYLSSNKKLKVSLAISLVIISTGLVVTFSRLAWVVGLLGILVFLAVTILRHRPRRFSLPANHFYFPGRIGLIIAALLIALGLNLFLFGTQITDRLTGQDIKNVETSENYVDRKTYGQAAWKMFKANPLFGVGYRSFVARMENYSESKLLPHQHQPVHNIYLLILAEAGILALISFLLLLFNIVRPAGANKKSPARETLLIIFLGFLALGFFDHYFLTIEQGSVMFWLTAGMLAAKQN